MNKKISLGLTAAIVILAVAVSAILSSVISLKVYNGVVSDVFDRGKMYDSLAEADEICRAEYFGDIDKIDVGASASSGYVEGLGGQCRYFTADEYEKYLKTNSGTVYMTESVSTPDGMKENVSEKQLSVVLYGTSGKIGYIRIAYFCSEAVEEFSKALEKAKTDNVKGIVFDVRSSYGNDIDSAAKMIDMIVPLAAGGTGAIAVSKDKNGENVKVWSADADSVNTPCAVLINGKTSSAGELFACDIRDFGKGVLVGSRTYGDGMYYETFELSNSDVIMISTAEIIPYGGKSYNGTGLAPDYSVTPDTDESRFTVTDDAQFAKAVSVLSE